MDLSEKRKEYLNIKILQCKLDIEKYEKKQDYDKYGNLIRKAKNQLSKWRQKRKLYYDCKIADSNSYEEDRRLMREYEKGQ